jgi:predicted permease
LLIQRGCLGRHSLGMKLTEAWRLSSLPYREVVYRSLAQERGRMWWGAFGRNPSDRDAQEDVELSKRALRIAKFDKIVVAVFNLIVSVSPFASLLLGSTALGLTGSVSLSLAITFGFMTLYAIQTLSSFVSAESSALLSTLPITSNDFSLVTLFSFVRSVDYLVVGAVLSQVVLVAYLTSSPVATALMFGASLMNSVFAVAVALWFSRVFHKNYLRGGRSKRNTVFRGVFVLVWGCLLLGVGLLLSMPYYVLPVLDKALLSVDTFSGILLSFVYPFSAGLTIAKLAGSSVPIVTAFVASVAMAVYAPTAWFSAKWSLGTVKRISQGAGVRMARLRALDFQIKARGPLRGYVTKDLRVTSRNPATAFFFALPVLETVIVAFLATNYELLRASTVIVATSMGAIFTLIVPLALVSSEGKGLEYAKTLPITPQKMVSSKALITMATYIPVPFALLCIASLKPLTSRFTILIPFFMIIPIVSASVFEIMLFLRSVGKSKIAGIVNDAEKIFVGLLTILVPEGAYVVAYLFSFNHAFAILTMGGVTVAELLIALYMLGRK